MLENYFGLDSHIADFTWPMSLDHMTYFTNGVDSSPMVIRCWTSNSTTCDGIMRYPVMPLTLKRVD
jgi:hypothetical protein